MSLYKIVLVGLGGVGKSCFTIQFIAQRFVPDYEPTLEDSYRKQITVDNEECILDIFDTAGQEDFSAVRDQYMRSGDGFLCIYSTTYAVSFNEVQSLYDHILRVKDADRVPFVLVGNKCDLEAEREVPKEKGEELSKEIGCKFFEASAKTRLNVAEAFYELVRDIKQFKKTYSKEDKEPTPGSEVDKKKKKGKGPCVLL